ncbi:hypothetical protein CHLRE_03g210177v5 [Chlamydomonas reinhardtii]|uniref:Caltractin n=1 Tax=Chlamydomonas reinhardtii TaxID=3055 RepID=A8JBV7_CHLRE|nr:uncharacterized protein CHLRE_03g210177v5 [Chlamydomonas reinhardtii]PNW86063.1 hypothetical protein CHLRE_03g210177v5 [Chlamydomonas reinhardtii]|eukprot:XP_001699405.1 predicted protein [Chlamydomonas reinhardtii]
MAEAAEANADLKNEYGFTDAQIAEFREAFAMFDRDGDGTVSTKELKDVFSNLGLDLSDEEITDLVMQVDLDASGTMTLTEFCILMAKTGLVPDDPEAELRAVFNAFDDDKSNHISMKELQAIMLKLGEKLADDEVEAIFKEAGCTSVDAETHELTMTFKNFKDIMKGANRS